MNKLDRKNMICFGLGTVGRDMFYALEANALIYYLSHVLKLPIGVFLATSLVYTVLRIFDALNDPLMGLIVDNTRSRFGKFKPPIIIGAVFGAVFYMLLFTDFGLRNYGFAVVFGVAYILWDIFYGLNDIAYWSMLPSLSLNQKIREKMGAFARICANIGMFAIMVSWEPITSALGNTKEAWFNVALTVTILMLGFQMFTVFGVKEKNYAEQSEEKITLKGMWRILKGNDQLMWTTLSMSLFTIGYVTTTTISIYYMQYVFGNKDLYAVLALTVGVAQLSAITAFSFISKHIERRKFYFLSTVLVIIGYICFSFAENSLVMVIISALLLFIGQAFIQTLMLMFLEDTIEYGQWKLGSRNESITLSVQPLINKIGGALSTGFVSLAVLWSGIKTGDEVALSIDANGKLVIKLVMIAVPMVFIVAGYLIYRAKYKIDRNMYERMVRELSERGELNLGADEKL